MSLSLYKKKRSFNETPEPEGKKKALAKGGLKFVIQKHAASHLHYDFRLEMEGVLKSWAVPKGPSLNPKDKRLAMMVEDHPFDYKNFEGTIPGGNYGAGTVMVWDEGTYEALGFEDEPAKKQDNILLEELKKGDLKIVLHGEKIKGAFALVKLKRSEDNSWLLIKKADKYVSESDVTKKDKSVKTGRSLAQIGTTGNQGKKKERAKSKPALLDEQQKSPVKKNSRRLRTSSKAKSRQ
jgi:bifunctional non-homologous end joining protein LigD